MKPLLVDTGPLVAIINQRDARHADCVAYAAEVTTPLLTTWPVLTEVAWLLRADLRDVDMLFRMIDEGDLRIALLDETAARYLRKFFETYSDQQPDLADGSLVYMADRLSLEKIFTIDERDFLIYRKLNGGQLEIVP